jgi:hypothetical protein
MKKSVLLLSFSPAHKTHNGRLVKLLQDSFEVEHYSFVNPDSEEGGTPLLKILRSKFANTISLPLIASLLCYSQLIAWKFGRKESNRILLNSIESYFGGSRSIDARILNLNRTLRAQKNRVELAESALRFATKIDAVCLLLPEDSNYYASGMIIEGAHKMGIRVGIVNYTTGTESEFNVTGFSISPDRDLKFYYYFAKVFLVATVTSRWSKARRFINSFPGSLETRSHKFLRSSYDSGMADFYITSSQLEFRDLQETVNPNAVVCLVEPIELTLARNESLLTPDKKIFGVFLPPNQLSDPAVSERFSRLYAQSYEEVIFNIVKKVSSICLDSEELVIFPHPRMYLSESEVVDRLSKDFRVVEDFSQCLLEIKCALIFSSATFSALLAAGARVFNFDLYRYEYEGVFPLDHSEWFTINDLEEIDELPHTGSSQSLLPIAGISTVSEFLVSYL